MAYEVKHLAQNWWYTLTPAFCLISFICLKYEDIRNTQVARTTATWVGTRLAAALTFYGKRTKLLVRRRQMDRSDTP